MATDLVDVGTTADDGTGDTVRAAFQAVNTMLQVADATSGSSLTLLEDTDSGVNTVTITPGTTAITSNRTVSLGDVDVTLDQDVSSGADVTFNDVTIGTTSIISAEDGTAGAYVRLAEITSAGTNYVDIKGLTAGLTGNRTLEIGDLDVTLDQDVASGSAVTFGDITVGTVSAFLKEDATSQAAVRLGEDSDNGSSYVEITPVAALTSNRTLTLGDVDVTLDQDLQASASPTFGGATISGRLLGTQGSDVASANDLTLGSDGNVFEITGTTQVNRIVNTSWQNGAQVTLFFTASCTVADAQASAGANITILLAGGANYSATAGDNITLMLSEIGGTQAWREISRTVV
jgi:hypothetical protein